MPFVPFAAATGYPDAALDRAYAAAGSVDPARLRAHVGAMHDAHQRDVLERPAWGGSMTHTHHLSAAYVRDQLASPGYTPVVGHSDDDGLDVDNIYADIRGSSRPDEQVLLTAHHDAWWQSGADDNASGVSIVLEAARILRDTHPARTIRLVAFDREEEGLIGANRYLAAHAVEHVAMIVNMDCVGFASDEADSQRAPFGLGLRSVGNFILVVADEPAADALSRIVRLSASGPGFASAVGIITPGDSHYPVDSSFLRSDHAPFWRRGVPGLFLTDTANFRNTRYHTPSDTPDTVNFAFLEQFARLVVGAVAGYAEGD
ncbi:MAG: M28 family peptidase [Deltaproteobacteria bacterium]